MVNLWFTNLPGLPFFPFHMFYLRQADTKDLTSSAKFSVSCVLTLQTLPWFLSCGQDTKVSLNMMPLSKGHRMKSRFFMGSSMSLLASCFKAFMFSYLKDPRFVSWPNESIAAPLKKTCVFPFKGKPHQLEDSCRDESLMLPGFPSLRMARASV